MEYWRWTDEYLMIPVEVVGGKNHISEETRYKLIRRRCIYIHSCTVYPTIDTNQLLPLPAGDAQCLSELVWWKHFQLFHTLLIYYWDIDKRFFKKKSTFWVCGVERLQRYRQETNQRSNVSKSDWDVNILILSCQSIFDVDVLSTISGPSVHHLPSIIWVGIAEKLENWNLTIQLFSSFIIHVPHTSMV